MSELKRDRFHLDGGIRYSENGGYVQFQHAEKRIEELKDTIRDMRKMLHKCEIPTNHSEEFLEVLHKANEALGDSRQQWWENEKKRRERNGEIPSRL